MARRSLLLWVRDFANETIALFFVVRDPRTPLHLKMLAVGVVLYFFSPIDFIPDFIAGFGWVDDLILVPWMASLILRIAPEEVRRESELKALGVQRWRRWIVGVVGVLLVLGVGAVVFGGVRVLRGF